MKKAKRKVIEAVQVGGDRAVQTIGRSLKDLREVAGITQKDLAQRLELSPARVSQIERGGDVHVDLLIRYVEALGGQLQIDASFSAYDEVALNIRDLFDVDIPDENQLVFPIFGDHLFRQKRDVVLSIRPMYSEKIFEGKKTVELRRRFPIAAPNGAIAFIYSTSPVRAMVGSAQISNVVKLPIEEIWNVYSNRAYIEKDDFESYFSGLEDGYAIEFENVRPFPRPVELVELRKRFEFEPPQSFLYAKPSLRKALQDEYSSVSH